MYVVNDQLRTNLAWWGGINRKGNEIILTPLEDATYPDPFVLAVCDDEEQAIELFKALNEGLRYDKKSFDLGDWNRQQEQAV